MANSEQPGRELDRKVGEAMGWTGFNPYGVMAYAPGIGRAAMLPKFSTDPVTIAEMLEWLAARTNEGYDSGVTIDWKGSDHPDGAFVYPNDSKLWAAGQTIQHALALLVVEVAKHGE